MLIFTFAGRKNPQGTSGVKPGDLPLHLPEHLLSPLLLTPICPISIGTTHSDLFGGVLFFGGLPRILLEALNIVNPGLSGLSVTCLLIFIIAATITSIIFMASTLLPIYRICHHRLWAGVQRLPPMSFAIGYRRQYF